MLKEMKKMQDKLISCTQKQFEDLSSVDVEELGEVIDMIKDFSEAIYYKTIVKAMEEHEENEEHETRENQAWHCVEMYKEAKAHHDIERQKHELELYMMQLTKEVMEIITDATPEEKSMLLQKLTALENKLK